MTQAVPPRVSQLMRIHDLENKTAWHDKRIDDLATKHEAIDGKLDGVLVVLVQIKTALWLFGKIGGAAVGLAIIAGAVVGVWHALGH